MERNEFALAGALLLVVCLGFLFSLAVAGAHLPKPELWAAWAQGIGSLLALAVAISVPLYVRALEKSEAKLQFLHSYASIMVECAEFCSVMQLTYVPTDPDSHKVTIRIDRDLPRLRDLLGILRTVDPLRFRGFLLPKLLVGIRADLANMEEVLRRANEEGATSYHERLNRAYDRCADLAESAQVAAEGSVSHIIKLTGKPIPTTE